MEITAEAAARKMEMNPQKLRVMMQLGYLKEVGIAFRIPGNKKWSYYIQEESVDRYLEGLKNGKRD
ncbi:MAG: hypothetical protein Q4G60_14600 [bacterium]|nr:hypothetical protein [bacterium]